MSSPEPRAFHIRPWVWRFGLLLAALAVLVPMFVALGHSARVDEPTDLDFAVHSWVVKHRPKWPWLTALALAVTRFGDPPFSVPASLLVAAGLYVLHRRGVAGIGRMEPVYWLGVMLGGWLVNRWLKLVFRRERPPLLHRLVTEESYSFPSGHSSFAANFFTMLAFLLARAIPPSRPWLRAAAVASCATMAVLVAASRIWLGVHFLTDVVGGLLLGVTWVVAAWLVRTGWTHRGEDVVQAGPPEAEASPP